MSKKSSKKQNISIGCVRESYADSIGAEAVNRGGSGVGTKGVVLEMLDANRRSSSPKALLNGEATKLTKSNTATCVDAVTMKNGRVVNRFQHKDITSDASMRELHKRVGKGDYNATRLVGTTETCEKFNRTVKSGRTMENSGISSKTTTRIADNAGAKVRDTNLLKNNMKDVGGQAVTSGAISGVVGAATAAEGNLEEYRNGSIDGAEFTARIAVAGAESCAVSAVKTAAALGIKEGGKQVAQKVGQEGLKKIAGSNAMTNVAFGAVEQVCDTAKLFNGDIDGKEYAKRTVSTAASTYGGIEGAALGATIGSAVPVVGTVVGAVVGGIIGSVGGGAVGRLLGGLFD